MVPGGPSPSLFLRLCCPCLGRRDTQLRTETVAVKAPRSRRDGHAGVTRPFILPRACFNQLEQAADNDADVGPAPRVCSFANERPFWGQSSSSRAVLGQASMERV